jgi:hypothetical protein
MEHVQRWTFANLDEFKARTGDSALLKAAQEHATRVVGTRRGEADSVVIIIEVGARYRLPGSRGTDTNPPGPGQPPNP